MLYKEPDAAMDSLVLYLPDVREITEDEFDELYNEFAVEFETA